MARGDYGPEIRQSMDSPTPRKSVPQRKPGGGKPSGGKPAESARSGKGVGGPPLTTNSAGPTTKLPATGNGPPQDTEQQQHGVGQMHVGGGSSSPAHAAMATSIAHAILSGGH